MGPSVYTMTMTPFTTVLLVVTLPSSILSLPHPPSLSSPSQAEFNAVLTLSKAGLLTRLTYLELHGDDLDLDSIPSADLAVLFSITEEIELIGVDLPSLFWRKLAERSRRSDWAVKSLSIEKMNEMTGLYEDHALFRLAEVISQTEEVWLSEIDSKFRPGVVHSDISEISGIPEKCKMLEFWFDSLGYGLDDQVSNLGGFASRVMGLKRIGRKEQFEEGGGVVRFVI